MTAILRRLPFQDRPDEVAVGTDRVRIRPHQIIAWVSLSPRSLLELPPHARRFPAILDTGYNHNLSIQRRHLRTWAGIDPAHVPSRGAIREGGRRAELYVLRAWLHPNKPGQRDQIAERPAFGLETPEGVAVYPDEAGFPPLPLLGLRALVRNRLHLLVDAERRVVSLRTADWVTALGRRLRLR